MKLVFFSRPSEGYHIHAGQYASCIYLPEEKIILISEQKGSFGVIYTMKEDQASIDEAEKILNGSLTRQELGTRIQGFTIEVDDPETMKVMTDLIADVRMKDELTKKVKSTMDQLFVQVREAASKGLSKS
jgi:hypothetical protein